LAFDFQCPIGVLVFFLFQQHNLKRKPLLSNQFRLKASMVWKHSNTFVGEATFGGSIFVPTNENKGKQKT
jgi:hypothetical protein